MTNYVPRAVPSIPVRRARSSATVTAGYLLVTLTAGAYLPSPLYPGYQREFGFSDLTLTAIYAVFALASAPALLLAGRACARFGRGALLRISLALAATGSGCFLLADGPVWLIAGRVAQGLALGIATVTATALIAEQAGPGRRARASLLASTAFVLGTAIGPLAAGLFAEYSPAPLLVPYLAHLGLLGYGWLRVAYLPPAPTQRTRRPSVPFRVPRHLAAPLISTAAAGFLAWTALGLLLALLPSLLRRSLQVDSPALTGTLLAAVLLCSAATQLGLARLPDRTAQHTGTLLLTLGLLMFAAGLYSASLPLTMLAIVAAGAGHGLAYRGATGRADAVTSDEHRGPVAAIVYLACYLGSGLPAVLVGLLSRTQPLTGAVIHLALGAAVLGMALLSVRLSSRRGR